MKSFAEFVDQPRKNLHLDHLDEAIFIQGTKGAKTAIDFISALTEGSDDVFVTTKWDGAPAVFVGTDPADGRFFVATKSVFNKTPKLYKEEADIIANEPAGKAYKLRECLRLLRGLNVPKDTVLQGDLLWTTGDHQYRIHEGKKYVTVHPNTLIYAWEDGTKEAQEVRNAELGIVFHTTYRGQGSLQNYQATFGANTTGMVETRGIWVRDSMANKPVISEKVKFDINTQLFEARDASYDADVTSVMESIPSSAVGANIKTFFNNYIRGGYYPPANAFEEYVEYVKQYYNDKVIEAVKTDKTRQAKLTQMKQLLDDMKLKEKSFHNAFYYTTAINEAKSMIIESLNASNNNQKVFVEINGELKETTHEGYVVVNARTGNGMKLVDREKFSHYNFNESVKKGWQK